MITHQQALEIAQSVKNNTTRSFVQSAIDLAGYIISPDPDVVVTEEQKLEMITNHLSHALATATEFTGDQELEKIAAMISNLKVKMTTILDSRLKNISKELK